MAFELTDNYAAAAPYRRDFEATVQSVDGSDVQLDETYFYAEGGGQPADRGTLNSIEVVDVQSTDGKTVHTLATEPDFEAGDIVTGSIDEEFRTYCMRAHTASHLLYGAGRKLFDDLGYGGFDIGPKKARLDFKTDHDPNEVNALTLERMLNEAVWKSKDVSWRQMNATKARDRDDIVFNLTGKTDGAETVRIVEVEDWDIAACGGTHVQNTNEIGPVKVLEISNPGSDLVRVEYAVGPTAIQAQLDEARAATRAAQTLDTSVEELPKRTTRIVEANSSLETELDQLREQLLEERLDSLVDDSVSKHGQEWVIGELDIDGIGPNDVSEHVQSLAGDIGDVVALTGVNSDPFVVVGSTGEPDASEIIDDLTATFSGGGGGSPTFAQGGGFNSEPSALVEYLRTKT